DLGGENDPLAHRPRLRLQPCADGTLAPSSAVRIRGVEERDPEIPRRVHDVARLGIVLSHPEESRSRADPAEPAAAQGHPRDRDAGLAEPARFHRHPLAAWRHGRVRTSLVVPRRTEAPNLEEKDPCATFPGFSSSPWSPLPPLSPPSRPSSAR